MQKLKALLKEELSGWKPFDIIWLVTVVTVVTVISMLFSYNRTEDNYWIHIIASVCGIINVVLGGKGKLSNYLFGFIHCCLMIYITYISRLYADMSVTIYNFIMQFVGFFAWSKNMNKETHEVKKVHMKPLTRIIYLGIIIVGTIVVGYFMNQKTNDIAPYADAAKAVMQILAMVMMVRMYSEQWWIWIIINVVSIFMYCVSIFREGMAVNFPIFIMYCVYLINSIIMCIRWEKEARENDKCELSNL